ncbi:Cysteine-rich_membrane protein 2 [Hexamita inflata]|uniref:Cysteine-rich membrane protein 2 n=1 Tax=Hexamita inflata TaxID=28002 RepID=A0AA86TS75_9EUKA|nr:Cysteine-rich membrane protein 2 [Hexamita inflata]
MYSFIFSLCYSQCEWLSGSNVWAGVSYCQLNTIIDNQQIQNQPDFSIINVIDLHLRSQINGICHYQLMEIGESGAIKNTIFMVNASLSVPSSCTQIKISLFDSVKGSLDNITIQGNIQIEGTFQQSLLSNFIGYSFSSFKYSNISSELTFKINGEQVPSDQILSNFNQNQVEYIPSWFNPESLTLSPKWGFMKNGKEYYLQTYFSQSLGAIDGAVFKYHQFPTTLIYANNYDTLNTQFIDLTQQLKFTETFEDVEQRVYFNEEVVMAYFIDQNPIYCYKQNYDPSQRKCTKSCPDVNFNGICMKSCINGYFEFESHCYASCPTDQGAIMNDGICVKCDKFASEDDICVSSIPDKYVQYKQGVFSMCPEGKIQNGYQCTDPVECKDQFLIPDQQICVDICPPEYAVQDHNCVIKCENNQFKVQNECEDDCPKIASQVIQGDLKLCRTACPGELINNDGICQNSCTEGRQQIKDMKNCWVCPKYYNRKTQLCVNDCDFYNNTICEPAEKCPVYRIGEVGKICMTKCEGEYSYVEDEKICVQKCKQGYIPDNQNNCVCNEPFCMPCPDNGYLNDQTCVQNCFPLRNDDIQKICSSSCKYYQKGDNVYECINTLTCDLQDVYKYNKGDQCVDSCLPMFVLHGECTDHCEYYYYIDGQKICQTSCTAFFINEGLTTQCVDQCPNNGLYYQKQCQSEELQLCCGDPQCPQHKIKIKQECFDKCKGYIVSSENYECVEESCKYYFFDNDQNKVCTTQDNCSVYIIDKEHNNNYQCYKTCPDGYFQHGQQCTTEKCSKYININVCVDNCPVFIENNLCTDTCSNKTYYSAENDDKICININSCQFYVPNSAIVEGYKQCIQNCDQVNYLDTKLCVHECPVYVQQSVSLKICYDLCTQSHNKFTYNEQCLEQCPLDQQYAKVINGEYVCQPKCKSNFYSEDTGYKICQDQCNFYYILSDKDLMQYLCVSLCPKYYNGLECVDNCVGFVQENICVVQCTGQYAYVESITNNTCVKLCQNQFYHLIDTVNYCTDKCNEYWSYDEIKMKQCKSSCDNGEFINNLESIESKQCILGCNQYIYKRSCVPNCQNYFRQSQISQQCVDSCTNVFITLQNQRTCVNSCPNDQPIIQNSKECLNECKGFIINENQCNSTCNAYKANITINDQEFTKCVSQCDALEPYVFQDWCIDICPKDYGLENNICVKCQQNWFIENNKCVEKCQFVSYQSYCYQSCSDINMFNQTNQCVNECNQYYIGDQCIDDCVPKKGSKECDNPCLQGYYNVDTRTCVDTCQKPKYIYHYYCQQYCDDLVLLQDSEQLCVDSCKNYVWNKTCTDELPSDKYFTKNVTGKYITSCPPPLLRDDRTRECKDKCDQNQFNDTFYCVPQCNEVKPFFIDQTCVYTCPPQMFIESNKQCVSVCASKYYSIINNEQVCQQSCIRYYPSNRQFLCQNECNKTAPFVDSTTGIPVCSVSCQFYFKEELNERICISSCDHMYQIESTTQCTSICPGQMKIYGQWCVAACYKKDLFITENNECVQSCPAFRKRIGDEEQCTQQCPLEKEYLQSEQNPLCVSCKMWAYNSKNDMVCTTVCKYLIKIMPDNSQQCVNNPCKPGEYLQTDKTKQTCVSSCSENQVIIDGYRCNDTCSMFVKNGFALISVNFTKSTPVRRFVLILALSGCKKKLANYVNPAQSQPVLVNAFLLVSPSISTIKMVFVLKNHHVPSYKLHKQRIFAWTRAYLILLTFQNKFVSIRATVEHSSQRITVQKRVETASKMSSRMINSAFCFAQRRNRLLMEENVLIHVTSF